MIGKIIEKIKSIIEKLKAWYGTFINIISGSLCLVTGLFLFLLGFAAAAISDNKTIDAIGISLMVIVFAQYAMIIGYIRRVDEWKG